MGIVSYFIHYYTNKIGNSEEWKRCMYYPYKSGAMLYTEMLAKYDYNWL